MLVEMMLKIRGAHLLALGFILILLPTKARADAISAMTALRNLARLSEEQIWRDTEVLWQDLLNAKITVEKLNRRVAPTRYIQVLGAIRTNNLRAALRFSSDESIRKIDDAYLFSAVHCRRILFIAKKRPDWIPGLFETAFQIGLHDIALSILILSGERKIKPNLELPKAQLVLGMYSSLLDYGFADAADRVPKRSKAEDLFLAQLRKLWTQSSDVFNRGFPSFVDSYRTTKDPRRISRAELGGILTLYQRITGNEPSAGDRESARHWVDPREPTHSQWAADPELIALVNSCKRRRETAKY